MSLALPPMPRPSRLVTRPHIAVSLGSLSSEVNAPEGLNLNLGIDFGTCFMSAAYMQGGVPTPVRFGYNMLSLPSAAYVTPLGEVLMGDDATMRRQENPGNFRQYFKRDLGGHPYVFEGGLQIEVSDLVTRMFARAREAALAQAPHLGAAVGAVVTVPVSYEAGLRRLMSNAAAAAGFATVELLNEPLAAAEHWSALQAAGDRLARPFLVYDLGGGTFDAALVTHSSGGLRLMSQPIGQANIGGVKIDEALLLDLESSRPQAVSATVGPARIRRRLRLSEECRAAKERLSVSSETRIFLESPAGEPIEPYVLDRARLSALIAPLLEETLVLCQSLLGEANVGWNDLAAILLVGGSCRMTALQQLIAQRTGTHPILADDPALAVCFGAARHAERLAKERATPTVQTVKPYNPHRPLFDLWEKR